MIISTDIKKFDESQHMFLEGKGEILSNLETEGKYFKQRKDTYKKITASNIHSGEKPNAFFLR